MEPPPEPCVALPEAGAGVLGAVVPELRVRAEKLAADLGELVALRKTISTERDALAADRDKLREDQTRLAALVDERQRQQSAAEKDMETEGARAIALSKQADNLQGLIAKMEHLGVAKPVVGITVPTGYSFNLDGTAIYLTMASLFVAGYTLAGHGARENIAPFSALQWLLWLCCWIVTGLYATVSWRRGGQTLGMRPWRLHLRTREGGQPTRRAARP